MAAISTLTDDFTGTVIDAAKWTYGAGASQNGYLQGTATGAYNMGVNSVNKYDLEESSIRFRLIRRPNDARSSAETYFTLTHDSDNLIWVFTTGGSSYVRVRTAGANTDTAIAGYVVDSWLRVRETAGTVYVETSTDGSSWTTRHSFSTPAWIEANDLTVGFNAGDWGSTPPAGQDFRIDDLNPVTAVNASAGSGAVSAAAYAALVGLGMKPTGAAAAVAGLGATVAVGARAGVASVSAAGANVTASTPSAMQAAAGHAAVTVVAAGGSVGVSAQAGVGAVLAEGFNATVGVLEVMAPTAGLAAVSVAAGNASGPGNLAAARVRGPRTVSEWERRRQGVSRAGARLLSFYRPPNEE